LFGFLGAEDLRATLGFRSPRWRERWIDDYRPLVKELDALSLKAARMLGMLLPPAALVYLIAVAVRWKSRRTARTGLAERSGMPAPGRQGSA
jgi:hypothetical protein